MGVQTVVEGLRQSETQTAAVEGPGAARVGAWAFGGAPRCGSVLAGARGSGVRSPLPRGTPSSPASVRVGCVARERKGQGPRAVGSVLRAHYCSTRTGRVRSSEAGPGAGRGALLQS